MNRKKLTNNEKFIFNEAEFVNPLGKRALSDRSSAQRRLVSKAEMNKPSFESPIPNPVSPPYTPIRSTHVYGIGPGGEDRDNKNDPTTDPCVEEVVAKLAMLNTQSLPTNVPMSTATGKQKIPKPSNQVVFDPFEAYHRRSETSDQNKYILNHVKFKERSTNNQKGNLIRSETSVMYKPAAPLSPPLSPEDEARKQEAYFEREDSLCICLRPLKLILCRVCSNTTTGRLRNTCQVHPKALYLLDIEACPRCKETKMKEYELPEGFKQSNNRITQN